MTADYSSVEVEYESAAIREKREEFAEVGSLKPPFRSRKMYFSSDDRTAFCSCILPIGSKRRGSEL